MRSFEVCGITSNPDLIHCTKVGLAREASHDLYAISEELSQATGTDDSDSDDDQWSSCDEEDDELDGGDMDSSQDEVHLILTAVHVAI